MSLLITHLITLDEAGASRAKETFFLDEDEESLWEADEEEEYIFLQTKLFLFFSLLNSI